MPDWSCLSVDARSNVRVFSFRAGRVGCVSALCLSRWSPAQRLPCLGDQTQYLLSLSFLYLVSTSRGWIDIPILSSLRPSGRLITSTSFSAWTNCMLHKAPVISLNTNKKYSLPSISISEYRLTWLLISLNWCFCCQFAFRWWHYFISKLVIACHLDFHLNGLFILSNCFS